MLKYTTPLNNTRSCSGKHTKRNPWCRSHNSWNLTVYQRSKLPTKEGSDSCFVPPVATKCQETTQSSTPTSEMQCCNDPSGFTLCLDLFLKSAPNRKEAQELPKHPRIMYNN